MRVVLLSTAEINPKAMKDDHLMHKELLKNKIDFQEVSWHEKINWNNFDIAIIRTTWDYPKHVEKFKKFVNSIPIHVFNSKEIINWNIDKKYLLDLKNKHISIPETIFLDGFCEQKVENFSKKFNQVVIKPQIGAGGENTFIYSGFCQYKGPIMVQEFIEEIKTVGEKSLIYFNGILSHCVLKKTVDDEFRCQEEHGGKFYNYKPKVEEIKFAEEILKKIDFKPFYARVDVLNNKDQLVLMELELIEPSLYFSQDRNAAKNFVSSLKDLSS